MDNAPIDTPISSTRSHCVGKDKKYPDQKYFYPDICTRKRKMGAFTFTSQILCHNVT